jgi:hypothetical protein
VIVRAQNATAIVTFGGLINWNIPIDSNDKVHTILTSACLKTHGEENQQFSKSSILSSFSITIQFALNFFKGSAAPVTAISISV